MRPATRTVPTTGRHGLSQVLRLRRLAGTLVALLTVLLALVPADTARAAFGPVPAPAPAATHAERPHAEHPDTGPRADDPVAAGCAAQARVRHDRPCDRPYPPDHHATDPRGTDTGPAVGIRDSAPSACAPLTSGRSHHLRGRAPPAPSGT
ncbi:hypothetical protein B7755_049910 [Streptomyces sp. NBS 14/10]|uniref:hypothetical protein n=1 Tax=Streptomyces sp. NBS 14/10 TaxID=1945643 RepID=UPI000B7D0032|nr:hypothetical protein [Streptomyces sp. NBS 14/10]KAK1185493.1 hypothetical protein B7755_049910 [Streptomyces sp. NBS 14/10]